MSIEDRVEKVRNQVDSIKEFVHERHKALAVFETIALFGLAASIPIGAWALLSESNQQISTGAVVVPTPGQGAMSIYEIENPNSTPLTVTANITNGLGVDYYETQIVNSCSINTFNLRDISGVPSPFAGAMTLKADSPFSATVVGYDYPGETPDITLRLRDLANKMSPTNGRVSAALIQWIAGRFGENICTANYDKAADLVNPRNEPFPGGSIRAQSVVLAAGHWNEFLAPVTNQPQSIIRTSPLTSGPEADMYLESSSVSVKPGDIFTITTRANVASDIAAYETGVKYPSNIEFVRRVLDSSIGSTGRSFTALGPKIENGLITDGAFSMGVLPKGPVGNGLALDQLVFEARALGRANIEIIEAIMADELGNSMLIRKKDGIEVLVSTKGAPLELIYLPYINKP